MPFVLLLKLSLVIGFLETIKSLRTEFFSNNHHHNINSRALDTKGWSEWMPWECSVSCGGGKGTRSRICFDPDLCKGPEEERGRCNTQPCPIRQEEETSRILEDIQDYLLTIHQNFQLMKGDDVTMPCKGSMAHALDNRYPNAQVSWLLNGKPVYVDDKKKILEDNQDLLVKNVTHEDSGVFTCVVQIDRRTSVTVSLSTVTVQNDMPDLKVEVGYSFYLLCNGIILSRIFPSKLLQKWYHNTTLYKEFKDSSPRDENELYFKTSNYSDSGVWLCRIAEQGGRSRRSSREWVTNVITVQVMPPKTLIQKLIPYTIGGAVGLVLILLISLIYYIKAKLALRREIKAKTKKSDKTSKSSKKSKSKKKSKGKAKKDSKKSKGKSVKDSKKSKGKSDKDSKKSKGKSDKDSKKSKGKSVKDSKKSKGKSDKDSKKSKEKKKSHKRHGDSKSSKSKKKSKDKKK